MSSTELGRFLHWHELAMDCHDETPGEKAQKLGMSWQSLMSKLTRSLHEMERGIAYEVPPDIQTLNYERFLEVLEAAERAVQNLSCSSYSPDAVSGIDRTQTGTRIGLLGSDLMAIRENVLKLDRAFQILEPVAKKALAEAERIATLDNAEDNTFQSDANLPKLASLTLWSKNEDGLASSCMALPLISVKYASAGLLCSGNSWSEVPAIAENMEYLTHIIVYDSDLPWSDLGRIDYITLRIDFSRQFHKEISNENSKSARDIAGLVSHGE